MAIQNCKICGKLIGETPSGYCNLCKKNDPSYTTLHQVKDYLYEHPNTNAIFIARDTGISVSEIMNFVRQGHIQVINRYEKKDAMESALKDLESAIAGRRRR